MLTFLEASVRSGGDKVALENSIKPDIDPLNYANQLLHVELTKKHSPQPMGMFVALQSAALHVYDIVP